MSKALGMIEFKTVSAGVTAADAIRSSISSTSAVLAAASAATMMAAASKVSSIPIKGDLSAVDAAVETAKVQYGEQLIDSFVLGNPHEGILPARCFHEYTTVNPGGLQYNSPGYLNIIRDSIRTMGTIPCHRMDLQGHCGGCHGQDGGGGTGGGSGGVPG